MVRRVFLLLLYSRVSQCSPSGTHRWSVFLLPTSSQSKNIEFLWVLEERNGKHCFTGKTTALQDRPLLYRVKCAAEGNWVSTHQLCSKAKPHAVMQTLTMVTFSTGCTVVYRRAL